MLGEAKCVQVKEMLFTLLYEETSGVGVEGLVGGDALEHLQAAIHKPVFKGGAGQTCKQIKTCLTQIFLRLKYIIS